MTEDTAALAQRCGLCGAKPREPCRNTIRPDQPLPGRQYHWFRINTTPKGAP
jgi:hypothetical protein